MIADGTKNHLRLPRSLCISLVATAFIISQVTVYAVDDVQHLWKGSALLGLAYGGLFGLFPTITIEWFGLRASPLLYHACATADTDPANTTAHFSENWGFVSLSPMIGGNVFSLAFGRNLDAHAPAEQTLNGTAAAVSAAASSATALLARAGASSDSSHQCLQGRECYAGSLLMTIAACSMALVLSVYAGWRDWRSEKRKERARLAHVHAPGEVMWDQEE